MTEKKSTIIYTLTDEAPALATYSLLPIVNTFTAAAGINVETSDISLAARILANFPDYLDDSQKVPDALNELGELTQDPSANIIKLPNISASIPQLLAAIKELQGHGYKIPDYPESPANAEEEAIQAKYAKVLGSAVNPVLREGNSDRRAPAAVKQYARKNPHSMGKWSQASRTHVAHMRDGDFYSSDISTTMDKADTVRIELVEKDGKVTALKEVPVQDAEIISAQFMSTRKLRKFLDEEMEGARNAGLLFSLHLKATMMKVSDPIVFGHAVTVYFKDAFEKHADTLAKLGVNPNDGVGSVLYKIDSLPYSKRAEIERDFRMCYENRPELAMVDSDKGITNLHVPSDIIVDASMPAMIRNGGKMWSAHGKLLDTKAVIPDSCYATIYQEMINFCKHHDAFDPTVMGTVPNVGLMAQKAEEYGSHDKTFEAPADGTMRIVASDGTVLLQHENVEAGDVWRMFQAKDAPIQNWVKLAVDRARASGMPALFWLDEHRGHDAQMIKKVEKYLQDHDTSGLKIHILNPDRAIRYTMERLKRGLDTIAVTGNVLRDYLTDLFPILELGTSAKMLSIVPLMAGGGLFETGAGGSAPKHVQQFVEEDHLRWDSLGEFLAIAVSLEDLASKDDNNKAQVLAQTLDQATGKLLETGKSPSRTVGELDNRGSHFYLALYWAQALAEQNDNAELKSAFSELAKELSDNEQKIIDELNASQGHQVDMGGYFQPDAAKVSEAMRPSPTLNKLLGGNA
ncbi:NADP-dependent isocitrate dehydrogenase [Aestuariirhabdus sp. Z084]|uniref:NADP-dependent isocitrate dehydrogenase n=1 Tax=Aestuariirhabdus haliotis TaxID=2918751 RepID=UPI00201B35F3|nr:NADP-dependent isocitrate dehydrogenase [Aestuariirhabdus haliotis]MCL6416585.1 NADP-dependent isocitrate dehydrogenase [Aestuariirhabdus haliotis]MCL6420548.1 NADP-dependent isocitrate dehydrogenase [Aestuariirhabdus haliotis]